MGEFVFPKDSPHCVTINGSNLIFSRGLGIPLLVNEAALGLVQNCSGKPISESRQWLRDHYGERAVSVADEFRKVVEVGYLDQPQIDLTDWEATMPPVSSFGICITHKCNMQCVYCFAAGSGGGNRPLDIAFDTACAAVDFLFDTLQPLWVRLQLGITGEPQLRWDLVTDVAEYAKKRARETGVRLRLSVVTNGSKISPEMLDYLHANDDMDVLVSWDGPPEIHDSQRVTLDGKSSYEQASSAFRNLQSNTNLRLGTIATVCALNPDVHEIFAHLFDNGVRDLVMNPARTADPTMAVTEESLPAFKAGYSQLVALLLKRDYAQMERLFTIVKEQDYLGRYIIRILRNVRVINRCFAARSQFDVDTDGNIYPCPSLIGASDFRMGNVRDGLNEDAVRSFRQNTLLPNLEACQDCWAKFYCGGPCPYISVANLGRSDAPYKPICDLIKHLIELAAYLVARLKNERPGLLEHVLALRDEVPMGAIPSVACRRAPVGGLWASSVEAWKTESPIVLNSLQYVGGCKRWDGPSDQSATIHLQWDDEFLYVMAEVRDDEFRPPVVPKSEWWLFDSIQIGLDPQSDGGESIYPWKVPEGDYEYGVAWVDGKTCLYDCRIDPLSPVPAANAVVTREEDITTYKVAMPWHNISGFTPSIGAECRFSIVINDCDGGVRGWLQWTHGLAVRKAPARWGSLHFAE